jgi:hypothetical protein
MQYLREQAKENIKEYVTQHLPEQYQICLCALDSVLKNAFVIMTKSEDDREKLHAMELFKDTHLVKLELLSNATTIDHALEYIRSKQPQQQKKANSLLMHLQQVSNRCFKLDMIYDDRKRHNPEVQEWCLLYYRKNKKDFGPSFFYLVVAAITRTAVWISCFMIYMWISIAGTWLIMRVS